MVPALHSSGWSFSALPRVDARSGMAAAARALDPGFHTVQTGAYDGQFYWGIAVDPLATGSVHAQFDKASYRYGHPLYGWLGWIFSAGVGQAAAAALAAVGLASLFVSGAAAALLGLGRGGSGWEGLFAALNVGLIGAAAHDLGEPLAAAVLLVGLLVYVRGLRVPAWICFALLPFAKEPLVLVPIAVVAWELAHGRRRTVAALVALLVLFAFAAVRALRTRGPVELAFLGLAAIAVCLAPNATVAFTTALRNTAFLVVLLPFVLLPPSLTARAVYHRPL